MSQKNSNFIRRLKSLLPFFVGLLACAGAVRLMNVASNDSQDFHVYWKAVQSWFSGLNPYLIRKEDHGFVYKYPPWTLPFFLPFKWAGMDLASGVWVGAEFAVLYYCVRWLIRNGIAVGIAITTLFLYWYMWMAHFDSGQVTLFLLAAALWSIEGSEKNRDIRSGIVFTVFTTKVFSLFSLIGIYKTLLKPRAIGVIAAALLALNALVWIIASRNQSFSFDVLVQLYRDFQAAAGSGGIELGAEVVRGNGNHGFPAMILKQLDPLALHVNWDIWVSLVLSLCVGMFWYRATKSPKYRLSFQENWAGWLALGVVIHPLAWHHSFVMAFPLSAMVFQAASEQPRAKQIYWKFWALFGTSLITILVPQVVGKDVVKVTETFANKSWGVLLLCVVLLKCRSAHYAQSSASRNTQKTKRTPA